MQPKKEAPAPDAVLNEVTTFVRLARDGAYMAGDRRVHHTERSKWRLTLLDRLAASPGLAGPELLTFLRARIAERRGERIQAAEWT